MHVTDLALRQPLKMYKRYVNLYVRSVSVNVRVLYMCKI